MFGKGETYRAAVALLSSSHCLANCVLIAQHFFRIKVIRCACVCVNPTRPSVCLLHSKTACQPLFNPAPRYFTINLRLPYLNDIMPRDSTGTKNMMHGVCRYCDQGDCTLTNKCPPSECEASNRTAHAALRLELKADGARTLRGR